MSDSAINTVDEPAIVRAIGCIRHGSKIGERCNVRIVACPSRKKAYSAMSDSAKDAGAETAMEKVRERWPDAYIAGSYSPSGGNDDDFDVVVRSTGKVIGSGHTPEKAYANALSRMEAARSVPGVRCGQRHPYADVLAECGLSKGHSGSHYDVQMQVSWGAVLAAVPVPPPAAEGDDEGEIEK